MIDLNQIKHCIQTLAHADPEIYARLVHLCNLYTYELMEAVTEAPTDEILVVKGRAQQARKFMQLLTEKPTP